MYSILSRQAGLSELGLTGVVGALATLALTFAVSVLVYRTK